MLGYQIWLRSRWLERGKVSLTVASLEWLDLALAAEKDLTGLKFHIKIDSGMGRIGFRDSQEAQEAIHRLQAAGAVAEGILPTLQQQMKRSTISLKPSWLVFIRSYLSWTVFLLSFTLVIPLLLSGIVRPS